MNRRVRMIGDWRRIFYIEGSDRIVYQIVKLILGAGQFPVIFGFQFLVCNLAAVIPQGSLARRFHFMQRVLHLSLIHI